MRLVFHRKSDMITYQPFKAPSCKCAHYRLEHGKKVFNFLSTVKAQFWLCLATKKTGKKWEKTILCFLLPPKNK